MKDYHLSEKELNGLWTAHHSQPDRHTADRIKAVYLLGMGWTIEAVATALLLNENSVRNHYKTYERSGIEGLLTFHYQNNSSYLSPIQIKKLEAHLEKVVYLKLEDIARYVEKTFKVFYSINGMRDLLHRLRFVYKKPKLRPAKTDIKAQQKFIRKYRKIQRELEENDSIYFMDATHPHYQTVTGYGWIKRGRDVNLPTTVTQTPININGAINIDTLTGVFQCEENPLTQLHTVDLLVELRKQQPKGWIYLISDQGGCYTAKKVKKFARAIGIKMIYLPSYSPNLNVIERLWLFFKKNILYNRTYKSFEDFSKACKGFFGHITRYEAELRTLLTDNFHLVPV